MKDLFGFLNSGLGVGQLALLGSLLLVSASAETVFTDPSGYVKLGNTTAGEDAVAANKDVYISIPFESTLERVGTVASATANSITFSGSPGWSTSPAQWEPNPTPYCVIVNSGAENGLRAVVSTNTEDTLTVTLSSPGDLTNVSAGDEVLIRRCWTLQTFFAPMNLPGGTQLLLRDETLTGINQPASATDSFVYGGGNWFDNATFADSNNVILHPGESFVLRSPSGAAIPELVAFGDVSTSSLRNSLVKDGDDPQGEDLFVASMSPVPALASSLNIPVSNGDQLLVFSPEGTGINQPASSSFVFGAGSWFDNITFNDVTSELTIEPGVGYVLRRSSSSPIFEEWMEVAPFQVDN